MSRQDLMMKYVGLVRALAWRIHRKLPRHVDVDELIAYGHLGLAEAARSFDESRGLKFSTFAYYRIRGAIFDGLEEMNWFQIASYHAGEYEETDESDQDQPPGENSSKQAPSRRTSRGKRRSMVLSLAQIEADQGDSLADKAAQSPGAPLQQQETEQLLWAAIESLPAEMKALIRWVYFDGLTLKEAGERLGHTKSWASRLHASAIQRMGRAINSG
jgi:RNA polymerase sigma factor for flagellar operon FliA